MTCLMIWNRKSNKIVRELAANSRTFVSPYFALLSGYHAGNPQKSCKRCCYVCHYGHVCRPFVRKSFALPNNAQPFRCFWNCITSDSFFPLALPPPMEKPQILSSRQKSSKLRIIIGPPLIGFQSNYLSAFRTGCRITVFHFSGATLRASLR